MFYRFISILASIALISISSVAYAQVTVPGGGTGLTSIPAGAYLVGSSQLRLAATTSPTAGYFTATSSHASTFPYASTTAISATSLCLSGVCYSSIAGADGTFSTTSADYWKGVRNFFSTTSADWSGSTKGYLTSLTGAASSTLLGDNNTFSGNNLFNASNTFSAITNMQNASTSQVSATTFFGGVGSVTNPAFWVSGAGGLYKRNTNEIGLTNGVSSVGWDGTSLVPGTTDARDLGSIGNRWDEIYGSFIRVTSAGGNATTTIFNDSSNHLIVKSATTTGNLTQLTVAAPDSNPNEADIVAQITPTEGGTRIFEFDNQQTTTGNQLDLTETVSGGAPFANWMFQMCRAGSCVPGFSFASSGAMAFGVTAASLLDNNALVQLASSTASRLLEVDTVRGTHQLVVANGSTTITGLLNVTNASTSNLTVNQSIFGANLTNCTGSQFLQWTSSNGQFGCATPAAGGGGGGGGWTFIKGGIYNSTTTDQVFIGETSTTTIAKLEVNGGIFASGSSTITAPFTTLYASTTNITFSSAGSEWFPGFTNGPLDTDVNGKVYKGATTTFSSPLTYSNGAAGIQAAGAAQNGYESSADYQLLHTATSTFSAPLVYSVGTNAVTCATCYTGNGFDFTPTTWNGLVVNATSTGLWLKATSPFSLMASSSLITQASSTQLTNSGTTWLGAFSSYSMIGTDQTGKVIQIATSSAYGPGTNGQVLGLSNGIPTWVSTTSSGAGVTSVTGTWPIVSSGGATPAISFSGLSTTTTWTQGGVVFASGANQNQVATVATGTVSAGSSAITVTAGRAVLGGALSIDCATAGSGQNGCLSSTDWSTFNNKQATLSFTTPLILTGTTVSFSGLATTSQPSSSNLLVSNGGAGVYGVATGTISAGSSAITVTAGRAAIGGALAIDCAASGASQNGCLSSTDWGTFNGKLNFSNLFNKFTTYATSTLGTTTPTYFPTAFYASSTAGVPDVLENVTVTGKATTTNATTTTFAITGVSSSLLLAGSTGGVTGYVPPSGCSNQFLTAITATGGFTCASVADAAITGQIGLSHGGTNASLSGANQIPYMNSGNTALTSNANLQFINNQLLTVGTTTPFWALTVSSSTGPQIGLSDGNSADYAWTMRSIANSFYLATSTATATSTSAIMAIGANGKITIASLRGCSGDIESDANGLLACGTDQTGAGGAGVPSKWATSTTDSNVISPAGAIRVTIGTTTPQFGLLTLGTSTAPQLMLTDNNAADNQWAFFNQNGILWIATSTALSTSTIPALSFASSTGRATFANGITNNGGQILSQLGTNSAPGYAFSGATNYGMFQSGTSLAFSTGGSNRFFISTAAIQSNLAILNSIGGSASAPSFGSTLGNANTGLFFPDATNGSVLGFSTNGLERARLDQSGNFGIGTTSPWGMLSIASSTYNGNTNQPLFAVATSSNPYGWLMGIWATSTTMASFQNPLNRILDSGARAAIGTTQTYDYGGLMDQMTVNGRINTEDWRLVECAGLSGAVTAGDINSACGPWSFQVSTAGQIANFSATQEDTGGLSTISMCSQAASPCATNTPTANTGVGFFFPNTFTGTFLIPATTTPVIEAITRISLVQNATSSAYYIGLSNKSPVGTALNTEATIGCYFAASSTVATGNWLAICRTSASANTIVDTGFASSTVMSGSGSYQRFRIEMDNVGAKFYMASSTAPLRMVANITTNYPKTTALAAGVWMGVNTAGLAKQFDVNSIKLWFNQPALNY